MRAAAALAATFLCAAAAAAQPPALAIPIDCRLGDGCFIQQYVDADPGPRAADYTCGPLSYDGHKGTDFALRPGAAMRKGVAVLAAAPGTVSALRDGMPDSGWNEQQAAADRDCGNGVVIDHDDGWQTQYCHLRRGSVGVTRGQAVARGDRLGVVGMSGRTQFPHVHLSVRRDGAVIDPFAPSDPPRCTDAAQTAPAPLWSDPPGYRPGGLVDVGFATAIPAYAAVKDGTAHAPGLSRAAPALVVWGHAYGGRRGDVLRLVIDGPGGPVITHDATLEKPQARLFRAAGRKRPPRGWPPGRYRATVEMIRDGKRLQRLTRKAVVD